MSTFDNYYMFRSSGNLTVSESNTLTLKGTPLRGFTARVVVPSNHSGGASDTILPKYWASTDGSSWVLVAQYEGGTTTPTSGEGLEMNTPIILSSKFEYLKEELDIRATTPNFGVVRSGIVAKTKDWDRSVHFD